jgi:hypothetical protein
MTSAQATDFASKWTVVDQYSDASGVGATVFQEIATGTKYLAIRGTTPTDIGDLNADYILASSRRADERSVIRRMEVSPYDLQN